MDYVVEIRTMVFEKKWEEALQRRREKKKIGTDHNQDGTGENGEERTRNGEAGSAANSKAVLKDVCNNGGI